MSSKIIFSGGISVRGGEKRPTDEPPASPGLSKSYSTSTQSREKG
jgi:hypothetical protein